MIGCLLRDFLLIVYYYMANLSSRCRLSGTGTDNKCQLRHFVGRKFFVGLDGMGSKYFVEGKLFNMLIIIE